MRLIDADALREKWLCLQGHDFSPSSFVYSIDNAPTIDAVQVVRCGECRRAIPFSVAGNRDAFCHCDLFDATMTRKDYCSYGERKEKEND